MVAEISLGPFEAHALQGFNGFGIILAAGEDQTAGVGAEFAGTFEERGIVALHQFKSPAQFFFKVLWRCKAGQTREAFKGLLILRQDMGLLVIHHLDAVFDAAHETVGRLQFIGGALAISISLRPRHPAFRGCASRAAPGCGRRR